MTTHLWFRRTALALGLCAVASSARPLAAQDSNASDTIRSAPWLKAVSVGLPTYNARTTMEAFTLGWQFTQLRPGKLSADFSIGTTPYVFLYGFGVLGTRGGVALPMEMSPGSYVIPSAGLSSVLAISPYGGGTLVGTNIGLAMILGDKAGGGVRLGVTRHQFLEEADASLMLFELGVLFGQRRAKPAPKRS